MLGQRSVQEAVLPVPPPGVCVGFSPPRRGQGDWDHNNPWASLYVAEKEQEENNIQQKMEKENTNMKNKYKKRKKKDS